MATKIRIAKRITDLPAVQIGQKARFGPSGRTGLTVYAGHKPLGAILALRPMSNYAEESPRALCGDVRYEHNESAYAPITDIRADIADGSEVPIGDIGTACGTPRSRIVDQVDN